MFFATRDTPHGVKKNKEKTNKRNRLFTTDD